jgi:hypothetical protein
MTDMGGFLNAGRFAWHQTSGEKADERNYPINGRFLVSRALCRLTPHKGALFS